MRYVKYVSKKSNKQGVSPVIAVILMVAITVVLAAVLYVMVSQLFIDVDRTPHMKMTATQLDDGENWIITMTGFTERIHLKDLTVVLVSDIGVEQDRIEDLKVDGTAMILGTPNAYVEFNKGLDDTDLLASQCFYINGTSIGAGSNFAEDWQLKVVFDPTGDTVDVVELG